MDIKNWKENLRELYLHTTPYDGYETRSITFNWGKFKIESKGKMEFYLATKESVEEFIDQLLQESIRETEEKYRHVDGSATVVCWCGGVYTVAREGEHKRRISHIANSPQEDK